jgi:hypothetical protein
MLIDGRVIADAAAGLVAVDPRGVLLAFYPDADIASVDDVDASAAPMVARVNHGHWIASCECGSEGEPSPGCVVWLDWPIGWCVRCGNAGAGGRWRPVVVPDSPTALAIAAVLDLRPDPATQNWEPGESVAELVAENAAHGLSERAEV